LHAGKSVSELPGSLSVIAPNSAECSVTERKLAGAINDSISNF
jgi:hypothetical protein